MGETDPVGEYERSGLEHRQLIERLLPQDWSWEGRRVLDFGCGSGRVIRQFAPEAERAELWGCDLDSRSIEWLRENLSPPFHFFETVDAPRLPQDDGSFDLIYAFSVYTHLTDNWAGWLLEHHRVLKDGGLLLVTFLGEGMTEALIEEPWDEDRIGFNALRHGNPWDHGGPITFNSPWWIRAHWGRAFEIVELVPRLDPDAPSHGCVLMRKRPVELTEEELIRPEPDEPREILAMRHQIEQLRDETLEMRQTLQEELRAQREGLLADRARLEHEFTSSASWRVTAPLRAAKQRLKRP